jgi:hypothetical protein
MSAYIIKSTGEYPVHIGDIVVKCPGTTEDNLPDDIALVVETSRPDKGTGQGVYEAAPIEINGAWTQQWIVRDLTSEEISSLQDIEQKRIDRINEESNG